MDGKNGSALGVTEATAAPACAPNAGDGDAVAGPPLRYSGKTRLAGSSSPSGMAERVGLGEMAERFNKVIRRFRRTLLEHRAIS